MTILTDEDETGKARNDRVRCDCGAEVRRGWFTLHQRSRRHQVTPEICRLRGLGLSDAEIGRQLGLTRAYVGRL